MKFGIVIPSYLYNAERVAWARRSFASLRHTLPPSEPPVPLVVTKPGDVPIEQVLGEANLMTLVTEQPRDAQNACAALAWGFDHMLERHPDVTHVLFVGDDFVYNPAWLQQQEALISRHPDARSWYVYRSSNERHHRTIYDDGKDVLVTNISGPGCFSRSEWYDWGIRYQDFPRPDGCTLDVLHGRERPGDRWVTRSSYVQQIGVRGMHNNAGECDEALEFVGEHCG